LIVWEGSCGLQVGSYINTMNSCYNPTEVVKAKSSNPYKGIPSSNQIKHTTNNTRSAFCNLSGI
jgi:hypothetical protein